MTGKTLENAARHRVALLVTADSSPFELGVVTAVFGPYLPDLIPPRYELRVCAENATPVPLGAGASLSTPYGLDDLVEADTVVVPSSADLDTPPSERLLEALRAAHRAGARMVSTCTGAFTLAAAGLLDGRRATTHWRWAELLRARHPLVEVDPAPLYVDDGDVLTSAGSAAGLDLCLHLVRKDFGTEFANTVARRLVIQPHRDGGQAQYVEAPVGAPTAEDNGVARSMTWALEHLAEPVTVADLARRADMSERSYLRHFARTTGSSPIRWLVARRVRASLPMLESTRASIEEVAAAVGFESVVTYRHHFGRLMRTSPSAYRRGFRAAPAGAPTDAPAGIDAGAGSDRLAG
ncbi:helix-turn-helix domain-containing protein [Streptomyces durbertensis]|uniref:Helix-turn-helix domain-containing protein n=1 Tax=Streptomyces durbertensis TaxID=2448886 RepID=A0ABR6ELK0_9ACTN|nr:helix-turn-helix domain-containing protein [Streptomyces durbertensis]MBB1246199.1 helix-turn-helix domain-containing protein [Streptomyces durbertensis]